MPHQQAMAIIAEGRGKHFDPEIVEVSSADSVDKAARDRICNALCELPADDDIRAESLLVEHAALLAMAFPSDFDRIAAAVGGFDFEQGLILLQQAMHDYP